MDNFDFANAAQEVISQVKKEYDSLQTLNIMLLGKTGVGKSTLVNKMFNKPVTETGIGKPITMNIKKYQMEGFPLAIYDTPGLELKGENSVESLRKQIVGEIQNGVKSGDLSQAIHCIWYCVSTPSHRFEQTEADFLRGLLEEVKYLNAPVIVVLTKSYSKQDAKVLKDTIEQENLNIVNIVPVLADDLEIDEIYTATAYGMDKLSELTYFAIPDSIRKTFLTIQTANLDMKKKKAKAVVVASTAAATALAVAPIPVADCLLLISAQTAMISRITSAFGIEVEKGAITAILSSTLGTGGATILGKTIVSSLLKLIPGAGSIAGGVISATTAAALTAALGEAYIVVMIRICEGKMKVSEIATRAGRLLIRKEFNSLLKLQLDKKGQPKSTEDA